MFTPFTPQLGVVASTPGGATGYTVINGTGTIFTWTVPGNPADGQLHRVLLLATLNVTSAETGGQMQLSGTAPNGGAISQSFFNSQGLGFKEQQLSMQVQSGSIVTLSQNSALTVGAAVMWADLLGA